MALQGFTRLRKHQFGRQAAHGTPVAATKAYAFRGTPDPNLNWTDPDVDVGSIDPVAAPYRQAPDMTAALTDNAMRYNSLPLMLSAIFGGNVTPTGGAAKTWHFAPASTTVDVPDVHTYEFGDDVLTDWFQFGDSLLESLEITAPEGLGACTATMTWRLGSIASSGSTDSPDSPVVPTDHDVVPNEVMLYLKDCGIYWADSLYSLDAAQVVDALHSFVLRITQEWDQKRFANASQNFNINGYGRGPRAIEFEGTWAKTAETVGIGSMSDDWMRDVAQDSFLRFVFTSVEEAAPGTPYSWTVNMPIRWFTRTEGEVGNNTAVVLTAHAFYDPDEDIVFDSTIVCTQAAV